MSKKLTWKDFNKTADKTSKYGSIINKTDFTDITDWISTGNLFLNASLSGSIYKGIPNNRITALAGSSQTGKTFILLNIYREAQKKGYYIVHFDSENDITPDKLEKFNIDPSKFRIEPVGTVQEFRHLTSKYVRDLVDKKDAGFELPKIMFGADSVGNMASDKERKDAEEGNEKVDFTRAKILRSAFRIITNPLAYLKMPFIFINHTYGNPNSFGDPETMGGGEGLIYAASNIVLLKKKQLKDGNDKVGSIIVAKPYKSRFVVPTEAEFWIRWDTGMNPYIGLQKYFSWENCGIEKGKIEVNKKTGEISFEPKATSRTYAVKHLGKNVYPKNIFDEEIYTPEFLDQLESVISEDLKYSDSYNDEMSELITADVSDNPEKEKTSTKSSE